jgi:hypothetical protein
MADAPDLKALAERYLDLWEQQVTAMTTDPALAEALARWLAPLQRNMAARGDERSASRRSAPAGASSRPRDSGDDELARRLGRIERRLAALERKIGRGRKP